LHYNLFQIFFVHVSAAIAFESDSIVIIAVGKLNRVAGHVDFATNIRALPLCFFVTEVLASDGRQLCGCFGAISWIRMSNQLQ
jgi:hypothetical protein